MLFRGPGFSRPHLDLAAEGQVEAAAGVAGVQHRVQPHPLPKGVHPGGRNRASGLVQDLKDANTMCSDAAFLDGYLPCRRGLTLVPGKRRVFDSLLVGYDGVLFNGLKIRVTGVRTECDREHAAPVESMRLPSCPAKVLPWQPRRKAAEDAEAHRRWLSSLSSIWPADL